MSFTLTPLTQADLAEMAPLVPSVRPLTEHELPDFYCARWQGEIVAIGGVRRTHEGNGEAMFLPVPGRLRGKVIGHISRAIRAILADAKVRLGLWRIHAMVHSLLPSAQRFAEHFGLPREARLRKAGPDGQDFYLYAWVKEDDRG